MMDKQALEIPKNHAEFLARCHAKMRDQILVPGSVHSKIDDTGVHVAFKIAGALRSDWAFASYPAAA